MNKVTAGKYCSILFHVDYLKIDHKDKGVLDGIISTLQSIFGEVSVSCGATPTCTYLSIDLDFTVKGKMSASMIKYFQFIVDDFPKKLHTAKTLAAVYLFDINPDTANLDVANINVFHQFVACISLGSLFFWPDLLTALLFSTTHVKDSDQDD